MQTFLNGQLATAKQLEEINQVMSNCNVDDGDFFILCSGKFVIDTAVYYDDSALIFTIDEYTQKHFEVHNISHAKELDYSKLSKVSTHCFNQMSDAKQYIQKRIFECSSVFN